MRCILAIAAVTGVALAVYFLRTWEQDGLNVSNEGGPPKTLDGAAQSDAAEYAGDFGTGGFDDSSKDASLNDSPTVVNWRQRPASALHWQDYRTKSYGDLRTLADAGDGHAASWLAYRLGNCSKWPPPQTTAEIDAAVAEMRRTHLVPVYRDGVVDNIMDFNNHLEALDEQVERYAQSAQRCSAFTVEQRNEWEHWTNVALSMGGPVDGLIHDNLLASMDSSDYFQVISDMWDSGDPTALHSLAAIHKRASWKEHDPSAQVRGYAYDLAIVTLLTDYWEEFDIPVDRDSLSAWEASLSEQRYQMHAHDIREADRLAKEIIERNENCCLVWPDYFIGDQ